MKIIQSQSFFLFFQFLWTLKKLNNKNGKNYNKYSLHILSEFSWACTWLENDGDIVQHLYYSLLIYWNLNQRLIYYVSCLLFTPIEFNFPIQIQLNFKKNVWMNKLVNESFCISLNPHRNILFFITKCIGDLAKQIK